MAFTSNQLITMGDMTALVGNEGYIQKAEFTPSNKLATKADVTAALYLAGTNPLSSYSSTQHVRYGDLSPLGTGWIGDEWECEDDATDNPPTAPTIVAGTVTSTSIEVDWGSNPGSDDNDIYYYQIEISDDNGSTYGDRRVIQDIFLGPDDYTYTGLVPSTSYKFRVRSVDDIGQVSSWSNILTQSTTAAGDDYIAYTTGVGEGYSNGAIEFWIENDSGTANDYVTVELQITSGGTTSLYNQWAYHQWDWGGAYDEEVVDGKDDAPISFTFTDTTVVYTGNSIGTPVKVYSGGGYRTGVGYYGYAYAQVRITNSSQGNTYPTGWYTFNIIGANSGQ